MPITNPSILPKNIIRQRSANTLTSTTAAQQIFNSTSSGGEIISVGSYQFSCMIYLTGMSATSGNSSFSLAGTATIGNILMYTIGIDSAPLTSPAGTNGSVAVTSAFVTSMQTAGTGTAQVSYITGTFEISVAGTIIPSIALATAATPTVNIGSYFAIEQWGSNTTSFIGPWS